MRLLPRSCPFRPTGEICSFSGWHKTTHGVPASTSRLLPLVEMTTLGGLVVVPETPSRNLTKWIGSGPALAGRRDEELEKPNEGGRHGLQAKHREGG